MSKKSIFYSKTFWTALGLASIAAAEGPFQELIKEQPPIAGLIVSIIMIVLRFATNEGVKLK